MAPRKICYLRYLLVVTKRRVSIYASCVDGSKIRLLLQAGYLFSIHVAPRFKAKDEKNIIPILHRPTSLITRGGENKNPVRTFRFPRLPLVVAGWRAMPGSGDVFLALILEERQCQGGSKEERLGVLSSPILCDKAKNRHQTAHRARAQHCVRP